MSADDLFRALVATTSTVSLFAAPPSKRRRGALYPSRGRRQVGRARSSGRHDWRRRLARRRGR